MIDSKWNLSMRGWGWMVIGFCWLVPGVQAAIPDYTTYPAQGKTLLLWVASERGRSEAELQAAQKIAVQGVEVWSLDTVNAYFLPQLPRSMDAVPPQDIAAWIRTALESGKQVNVIAVARAAVPVLRAAAQLTPAMRSRVQVLLLYPNLYTVAEPLAAPDYLDVGELSSLSVRVLQPRRSAATPWLPGLLAHLSARGAKVSHVILENLREGFWVRESPTPFEVAEAKRMDALILRELKKGWRK